MVLSTFNVFAQYNYYELDSRNITDVEVDAINCAGTRTRDGKYTLAGNFTLKSNIIVSTKTASIRFPQEKTLKSATCETAIEAFRGQYYLGESFRFYQSIKTGTPDFSTEGTSPICFTKYLSVAADENDVVLSKQTNKRPVACP